MRLRITLATVVLGLAAASVTMARQQTGHSPQRGQGNGQAQVPAAVSGSRQLRAQVAGLRAEVELGEIEHEVDKVTLSEMMKEVEQSQWKETAKPTEPADPAGGRTAGHPLTALGKDEQKVRINLLRAEVEQKRERFRERAIKLHEMKFALADLEERLANGWSR
jgi:Cu2+-containing amine oxidase